MQRGCSEGAARAQRGRGEGAEDAEGQRVRLFALELLYLLWLYLLWRLLPLEKLLVGRILGRSG